MSIIHKNTHVTGKTNTSSTVTNSVSFILVVKYSVVLREESQLRSLSYVVRVGRPYLSSLADSFEVSVAVRYWCGEGGW